MVLNFGGIFIDAYYVIYFLSLYFSANFINQRIRKLLMTDFASLEFFTCSLLKFLLMNIISISVRLQWAKRTHRRVGDELHWWWQFYFMQIWITTWASDVFHWCECFIIPYCKLVNIVFSQVLCRTRWPPDYFCSFRKELASCKRSNLTKDVRKVMRERVKIVSAHFQRCVTCKLSVSLCPFWTSN